MQQRRAERREVEPTQRPAATPLRLAQRVVEVEAVDKVHHTVHIGPRNEETPGVATPGGPRVLLAGVTHRVCDEPLIESTARAERNPRDARRPRSRRVGGQRPGSS